MGRNGQAISSKRDQLMEVLKRSLAAEWPTRLAAGRVATRRGKAARSKAPGKQVAGRVRKLG
jgi:hypothetical protein